MEERTKQRLVGALVLVGALFIILPFLFHNARPSAIPDDDMDNDIAVQQTLALPENATSTPVANTPPETTQTTIVPNPQTNLSQQSQSDIQPTAAAMVAETMPSNETPAPVATTFAETQPAPVATPSEQIATTTATAEINTTSLTPGEADAQPDAVQIAVAKKINSPASNTVAHTKTAHIVPKKSHSIVKAHHAAHQLRYIQIQVGVFSDPKNVKNLLAKLHQKHFTAYARAINRNGRILTGVYIAESDLTQAKLAQIQLKREFSLESWIVKHVA